MFKEQVARERNFPACERDCGRGSCKNNNSSCKHVFHDPEASRVIVRAIISLNRVLCLHEKKRATGTVCIPTSIIGFHWLIFHSEAPLWSWYWGVTQARKQTKSHSHSDPQAITYFAGGSVGCYNLSGKNLVAIKIQNACAFWPGTHTLGTGTYRSKCRNTKGYIVHDGLW